MDRDNNNLLIAVVIVAVALAFCLGRGGCTHQHAVQHDHHIHFGGRR